MGESRIYLSFNNGETIFQLPVNPESIEIQESGSGKTYDIIGEGGVTDETRAGEINVIKSPRLREVSLSSLFPAVHYPFVVVTAQELRDPLYYVGKIREWMRTRRPIRFIYSHLEKGAVNFGDSKSIIADVNMPVSIEKFEWKEVAGAPGDIEYSLSLKEYVFYSARKITVVKSTKGEDVLAQETPARPDERSEPTTYEVLPNETLWHVAKKLNHEAPDYMKELQSLNEISDEQLLDYLPTGTQLQLPRSG